MIVLLLVLYGMYRGSGRGILSDSFGKDGERKGRSEDSSRILTERNNQGHSARREDHGVLGGQIKKKGEP